MTRADEWHIKVSQQTRRRYKANAALHGLTLGDNLERLLDQDELMAVRAAAGLRMDGESIQEQSGTKTSPKAGNEAHSKNK